MPIEQQTIIDRIEIDRDGVVSIRFDKQLVRDGEVISETRYHRCMIEPGQDPEEVKVNVNAHLELMKEAPVSDEEWAKVFGVVSYVHTPEVIAPYQVKKVAKQAALPQLPPPVQ